MRHKFLLPLCLISLATAAATVGESASTDSASPLVRPRIYIYDLPPEVWAVHGGMGSRMVAQIKLSGHHETDGDKADYFWIPGGGIYPASENRTGREFMISIFEHVRSRHPWWNMTVALGQARHIIVVLFDGGLGEAFHAPGMGKPDDLPSDYSPASPTRNLISLQYNGVSDGAAVGQKRCHVCFQPGKDIMIPTAQNVCGPLCGYTIEELRVKSLWAPGGEKAADLNAPRDKIMFFAGSMGPPPIHADEGTGRGGAYVYYGNNTRYFIAPKGIYPHHVKFADAMISADFCYSPLGSHGGDPDRYVAGALFGCLPVMLNSSDVGWSLPCALPLEEALDWSAFATLADVYDLKGLDEQLKCLLPRVGKMRAALKEVWPRLLYTTIYNKEHGPYLGEDGSRDAFHTVMQILAARIPHNFRPPPKVAARFKHAGFPCRKDEAAASEARWGRGL